MNDAPIYLFKASPDFENQSIRSRTYDNFIVHKPVKYACAFVEVSSLRHYMIKGSDIFQNKDIIRIIF